MTKIELKGAVGDEIVLVHGENTLVVKIAKGAIVPDVVPAVMAAIKTDADAVARCAQNVYHHYMNAETFAQQTLSVVRDRVFNAIKPENVEKKPEIEPEVAEKPETTKKTTAMTAKSTKSTKKTSGK